MRGDTLEIVVEFDPEEARAFGLMVRCSRDGTRGVEIRYDGSLKVERTSGLFASGDKTRRPFRMLPNEETLSLRVFVDRAVIEVFANERACFETLIHPQDRPEAPLETPRPDDVNVAFFSEEGNAVIRRLDMWELSTGS